MARYYWNTYYAQPTVEEIRNRAERTATKARQKGKQYSPVVLQGRTIAHSWWGKAWCSNLERYADYGSRLPRGKRYVRSGAVVDLQIQQGKILARVQGRSPRPYKVEVRISPLSEQRCKEIIERCTERIDSLESLVAGTFPENLKDIFAGNQGLFPTPREISFDCSCPDWASMCKHVAATLYGVGARLDEDPMLFFSLRGIDVDRFTDLAISNRLDTMLANAENPSGRIITSSNWGDIFGVF